MSTPTGTETRNQAGGGAPPAGEDLLTYNTKGLVHWLVADVAGSIASRHGLRADAEELRDLPVPSGKRSPSGTAALLARTQAAVEATFDEIFSEYLRSGRTDVVGFRRPDPLAEAERAARRSGVWPGAVKASSRIMSLALQTGAVRDALDELRGFPVDDHSGWGWEGNLLWAMELDLRQHAREVTRWPIIDGEVEMIVGGSEKFWSVEELEAGS